ncbi:hypothetical protein RBSWK_05653 [Rhodopirellula baltica SWK14]|uniref:Uncharacterized protein n=1 Tax=Rhodopirellula baltica SWK14 TaxID=993516 RepID=L7CBA9_RHOBT|nr:hypothetical protein RBSWK_05653 [Rhodopirellula baltica SWK14]
MNQSLLPIQWRLHLKNATSPLPRTGIVFRQFRRSTDTTPSDKPPEVP